MKHVELIDLLNALPMPMTRTDKLLHWAKLIRATPLPVWLFNRLEYYTPDQLAQMKVRANDGSYLGLAAGDPVLHAQGLKAETNLWDIMQFFALTHNELHSFSCDCGRIVSREMMAERIEAIAKR